MIRIAHFSDLHYGPRTLDEADRCFGAAVDQAMACGAQVAVLSGDSTDHALELHSPAAERLVAQVRRLADHCPVLMLQGTFSHEPPGTLSLFKALGGRYPVHVADRIGQVAMLEHGQWVPSPGWSFDAPPSGMVALFSCIPTVNKAALAVGVGASEAAQAVGEQVAALLAGFAPSHRRARALGVPTIGVSHGTVFGCLSEHGVPMAGFDHEFTTGALFSAESQAFLLGHIHRHQGWDCEDRAGCRRIAYAGSIGRFHHGEEGDKGFLMWEVDAETAAHRLMPTPARRTVDIVFQGRPDLAVLKATIAEQGVAGAHVRVRWVVGEEDRHAVDRAAIQDALVGAVDIKLEGRIVPAVRTRAAGISRMASLAEKVSAWARATQAPCDPLLSCLAELAEAQPSDIADRALRMEAASPAVDHSALSEAMPA